jgi:hypothetical protein
VPTNSINTPSIAEEFRPIPEASASTPKTFLQRANIMLALGIPIVPLPPAVTGRKFPPCVGEDWQSQASANPNVVAQWAEKFSTTCNVGAVARFREPDGSYGVWFQDDDAGTLAERYKADTGQNLPRTLKVKTSRGYHYYFRHDEASVLVRYGTANCKFDIPEYKGESRCNNQYVLGIGSIHPTARTPYAVVDDSPIAVAPVAMLDWLQKAYIESELVKDFVGILALLGRAKAEIIAAKEKLFSDVTSQSQPGRIAAVEKLLNELKAKNPARFAKSKNTGLGDPGFRKLFDVVEYRPLLKRLKLDALQPGKVVPCPMPQHEHYDSTPCFGPIHAIPELLHCCGKCGWTGDMVAAVFKLDGGSKKYKSMYDCAHEICKEENLNFEDFFPAKPAEAPPAETSEPNDPSSLRPELSAEALYGLSGDIVKKILPETESHPAGLLVQTLMYFGNIIGRTAYYQVESDRHYGNLFAVRVGDTSKGRKGTGGNRINAVFENVDRVWFDTRVQSGLSSGEGLLVAVHDETIEEDKTGRPTVVEGGVHDKRLVSYEGEFAQVLSVMQRQGATIATNLRNAWDGKPMQTMTIKPRRATGHTISVLGDITAGELKHMLTQQDSTNGFANRFLWVYVHRTKLLPNGGADLDFAPEVERLQIAIQFAKRQKRVFMDRNAREMWGRAYERLAVDQGGLFGAVTSRGEAHTIRLALLYALLDQSTHIRSEHLLAALAFWQYCEDSARYIFDALTADQQLMLEFLDDGRKTKTDFLKGLFKGNRKAQAIQDDLDRLRGRGLIGVLPNKYGTDAYHKRVVNNTLFSSSSGTKV